MKVASESAAVTAMTVARAPYLNCAPFFEGLTGGASWALRDLTPRQLGREAEAGGVDAGPMSLADYLRLQDRFERVGNLGIAVRGRSGSALLFSRRPIRQLDGREIAVTDETATTAQLLRLILEQRHRLKPTYRIGPAQPETDAVLLIGDEALRFRAETRRFPYETDVAFEWWVWQHVPFVFAVWAVRKAARPEDKERLARVLFRTLSLNAARLAELAEARAGTLGLPAQELTAYLAQFIYRLGQSEEDGIAQFARLADAHHLR